MSYSYTTIGPEYQNNNCHKCALLDYYREANSKLQKKVDKLKETKEKIMKDIEYYKNNCCKYSELLADYEYALEDNARLRSLIKNTNKYIDEIDELKKENDRIIKHIDELTKDRDELKRALEDLLT